MSVGAVGTGTMMLPVGADMGSEIAALVLTTSSAQGKQASIARDAAEQAEEEADQEQVDQLHAKASEERTAATWSMVGSAFEGAASIGAGALELGEAVKPGGASLVANGGKWAQLAKGGGEIGSALARKLSGDAQARGTDDDAQAAQFEHLSSDAGRAAADAGDAVHAAQDLASKALDFVRDFESTSAQTAMAALHRA